MMDYHSISNQSVNCSDQYQLPTEHNRSVNSVAKILFSSSVYQDPHWKPVACKMHWEYLWAADGWELSLLQSYTIARRAKVPGSKS